MCIICIIFFTIITPITNSTIQPINNNSPSSCLFGTLDFYPKSYDFGNVTEGEVNSTTFEIWRAGGCCALEYALSSECEWIEIFPTSGISHGERDIITIYIDTKSLDPGHYSCNINITSNGGNGIFIVNFTIFIVNWPEINCEANLQWKDIEAGSKLEGFIYIMNVGDSKSLLDWMIISHPDWGIWNFSAESGYDITPDDPAEKINVSIIVPDEKKSNLYGEIIIINKHNNSDFCNINVSISTSRIKKSYIEIFNFLQYNSYMMPKFFFKFILK
jgi:hypothetical protein